MDHLYGSCNESRLFTGSVLVAEKGEVIYANSFGTVNFDSQEAIGPDPEYSSDRN